MINDQSLDRLIGQKIVELNRLERLAHEPSGKLSASMLGWPLQWQMLKMLGVESKPFDEYTIRKFIRGKQVEDWVVSHMDGVIKTQKGVSYKDCVGYVDAIIKHNGEVPQIKDMSIPHEIKSVTNLKFKKIIKTREADPHHRLQATLYAMALKSPYYAIDYVASDDLRVETFIYKTEDTEKEVETVIETFKKALEQNVVPCFEPKYTWQANILYNNYPEWSELTQEEINEKIQGYLKN